MSAVRSTEGATVISRAVSLAWGDSVKIELLCIDFSQTSENKTAEEDVLRSLFDGYFQKIAVRSSVETFG